MTIKELVEASGLNQREFSEKYHIPLRSVENWCMGIRQPPEYVVWMIQQLEEK